MPSANTTRCKWSCIFLLSTLLMSAYASTNSTPVDQLNEKVDALQQRLQALEQQDQNTHLSLDTFWLIAMSIFIFFMQLGFTMLEAGSVRAKNRMNILLKNLLDSCIGALTYYLFGFSLQYGGTGSFIGGSVDYLALSDIHEVQVDSTPYAFWFFHFAFAVTASTIVSGAMAERTRVEAYIVHSLVITGFIYPVVARWVWNENGWLSVQSDDSFVGGMIDFAGAGVLHMTGGVISLAGATFVGPRNGRFDEARRPLALPGQSGALQVLGTLCLWIGWFAFNSGSTLSIWSAEKAETSSRIMVTTALSAASSGLTVVFVDKVLVSKMWRVGKLCNGILAGCVSVTAGCASMETFVSIFVGIIGGLVYMYSSYVLLYKFKVDDPLHASAVHGFCGLWGLLAAALFATEGFSPTHAGLVYGDARPLAAAVVGALSIIAWCGLLSSLMFWSLKMFGVLRVNLQTELVGIDVMEETKSKGTVRFFEMVDGSKTLHLSSAMEKVASSSAVEEALVTKPSVA